MLAELISSTERALTEFIKHRLVKLFRAALAEIQLRNLPKQEAQLLESMLELIARFRFKLLGWSELEPILVLADLNRIQVLDRSISPAKEDVLLVPRSLALELSKHDLAKILKFLDEAT